MLEGTVMVLVLKVWYRGRALKRNCVAGNIRTDQYRIGTGRSVEQSDLTHDMVWWLGERVVDVGEMLSDNCSRLTRVTLAVVVESVSRR